MALFNSYNKHDLRGKEDPIVIYNIAQSQKATHQVCDV